MFSIEWAAWTKGVGMYQSMTYFAWVPIVVGLLAALYLVSVIALVRALRVKQVRNSTVAELHSAEELSKASSRPLRQ